MIEITRSLARTFRAVLKKVANARGQREQPTAVVFRTDRHGLHVRARNAAIVVEFSQPGSFAAEEIVVPSEALADFEGRKEDTVQLQRSADGVIATWQEGVVPRTHSYPIPDENRRPEFPSMPARMDQQTESLLHALRDASTMAANDSTRFAVNNIQLRGKQGKIVATDGKQLLVQSCRLPWDEDVLVPSSQVFGCKELSNAGTVSVGRSEKFVTLVLGPWTLHLSIDKDGRFPQIDSLLPGAKQTSTAFELDPVDTEFLRRTLPSLPGASDEHSPVTVEGNGEVVIRAKDSEQSTATEVVLARSAIKGKDVRIVTDRGYLSRALQLGFERMHVYAPDKPVVCRDDGRTYLWVPLDSKSALLRTDDVVRLSSTENTPSSPVTEHQEAELPVRPSVAESSTPVVPSHPKEAVRSGSERPGIADVLAEAEAIKDLLRDAYTRTHQLITGVRRYRKQAQAVQSSLKALKQLQQMDA